VAKESKAWIVHICKLFEFSHDASFKTDPEFGVQVLGLMDLTVFRSSSVMHVSAQKK
jgi:hypothetical protein